MTSVFGNVFRMSGGASVWANVFVLQSGGEPTDGWAATQLSRVVFTQPNRVVHASKLNRVVVALPERIR